MSYDIYLSPLLFFKSGFEALSFELMYGPGKMSGLGLCQKCCRAGAPLLSASPLPAHIACVYPPAPPEGLHASREGRILSSLLIRRELRGTVMINMGRRQAALKAQKPLSDK